MPVHKVENQISTREEAESIITALAKCTSVTIEGRMGLPGSSGYERESVIWYRQGQGFGTSPRHGTVHPAKHVTGLIKQALADGGRVEIYSKTPEVVPPKDRHWLIVDGTTGRFTEINAATVVLASTRVEALTRYAERVAEREHPDKPWEQADAVERYHGRWSAVKVTYMGGDSK